jgi:hypothetical protein
VFRVYIIQKEAFQHDPFKYVLSKMFVKIFAVLVKHLLCPLSAEFAGFGAKLSLNAL